jgi:hypothetical protein
MNQLLCFILIYFYAEALRIYLSLLTLGRMDRADLKNFKVHCFYPLKLFHFYLLMVICLFQVSVKTLFSVPYPKELASPK